MPQAIFVYNSPLPDPVASIRLMAFIPARHLGARALFFGPGMNARNFLDRYRPEVLIFTKAFDGTVIELARTAAGLGIRIISVFCDYYFDGELGELNAKLAALSDGLVVQTKSMAQACQCYGKPITLVEETIEYPRETPRFLPERPLKIVWFGSTSNHDTLQEGLKHLVMSQIPPFTIDVVTDRNPEFLRQHDPLFLNLQVSVSPWSPLIQHTAMQYCDFVFLPSFDAPEKRVKGHSRLVETINAGRLAIAHPLPQYEELADYCFCGEDYASSIKHALSDKPSVVERIKKGQDYIYARFAPDIVAEKWRVLIESK